jgi:hypothetical protein
MKFEEKTGQWAVSVRGWIFGVLYGALLYERPDFHWSVFIVIALCMFVAFWGFLDGDERALKGKEDA